MKKNMTYMDKVHRWGRIWNLSVMVILIMFPVSVGIIYGAGPDMNGLLKGLLATAPMYWAVGVIETITYIPMLGAGGSYLSFVTGNLSNLKLPCAINALEQAGVKSKSDEGEVVSTIAIAVSSIVTTIIIIQIAGNCTVFFAGFPCDFYAVLRSAPPPKRQKCRRTANLSDLSIQQHSLCHI